MLCLLLQAPAAHAATESALIHWQPSASPAVTGYRVYSRLTSGTYGTPVDAGNPTPASDGSLSYVLPGLDGTLVPIVLYQSLFLDSLTSGKRRRTRA